MKRILSTIIALSLTFCLAACKAEPQSTGLPKSGSSGSSEQTQSNEKIKISWTSASCGNIEPGSWAELYIEENLNIDLEVKKIDTNNAEQVDLMLSTGEMPDAAWLFKPVASVWEQGAIRSIPKEMIEKHAPNYTAMLNNDPYGWKLHVSPDDPNSYMALSGYVEEQAEQVAFVSMFRYDWLEKLDIVPNGEVVALDDSGKRFLATEPFTQDQFTEILKQFTEKDPDGNGQKDTIGMTAGFDEAFTWNAVTSMFGFQGTISDAGYGNLGGFIEQDGKAVSPFASDKYKAFLDYAQGLYKNGYLDKEFATNDRNQAFEKFSTGKAGFVSYLLGWVNPNNTGLAQFPAQAVLEKDPNAKLLITPANVANDGSGGSVPYSYTNYNYQFMVAEHVSDEKLARILELYDFINFDKDTIVKLRFGEEGEHFEWAGTPFESSPTALKENLVGGTVGLTSFNGGYVRPNWVTQLGYHESTKKLAEYGSNQWQKYLFAPYKVSLGNLPALNEARNTYGSNLKTMALEYFCNTISGVTNIDKDWDSYISAINKAGYTEFEKAMQDAPLYSEIAPSSLLKK